MEPKEMKVQRAIGVYGEGASQDRLPGQQVPVPTGTFEQPSLANAEHVRENEQSPESPAEQGTA